MLAGCLDVQNEVSVPWEADVGVLRDCFVRPCSRSEAMVLPPAVARDGVAVMSVLFLTLVGKDGGVESIVENDIGLRESEGVLPDVKYICYVSSRWQKLPILATRRWIYVKLELSIPNCNRRQDQCPASDGMEW